MQIYETLKARSMTTSWRDYSVRFLGRAPNYVSSNPDGYTLETFHNLFENLVAAGQHDLAQKVVETVFGTGVRVQLELV
jgi:hypothetical protein